MKRSSVVVLLLVLAGVFACESRVSQSSVRVEKSSAITRTEEVTAVTVYNEELATLEQQKEELEAQIATNDFESGWLQGSLSTAGKSIVGGGLGLVLGMFLSVVTSPESNPARSPLLWGTGAGAAAVPVYAVKQVHDLRKKRRRLDRIKHQLTPLEELDAEEWNAGVAVEWVEHPLLNSGNVIKQSTQEMIRHLMKTHKTARVGVAGLRSDDVPNTLLDIRVVFTVIQDPDFSELHILHAVDASGRILFEQGIQFDGRIKALVRSERANEESGRTLMHYVNQEAFDGWDNDFADSQLVLNEVYEKTYRAIVDLTLDYLKGVYQVESLNPTDFKVVNLAEAKELLNQLNAAHAERKQ